MADYKSYSTEQLKKDVLTLESLRKLRRSQGDDLSEVNIRALIEIQFELETRGDYENNDERN